MNTRALATLFVIVLAFGAVLQVFLPLKARAQDHHPNHADFYKKWMRPDGSGLSCCDARMERGGVETGDCEPTKAELRRGGDGVVRWHAWLRQESRWLEIPDNKLVRERNPNIFDAHLCWSWGIIHCFSPPSTGG